MLPTTMCVPIPTMDIDHPSRHGAPDDEQGIHGMFQGSGPEERRQSGVTETGSNLALIPRLF